MPTRIECDVNSGKVSTVDLTSDEIAYAKQCLAAEDAAKLIPAPPNIKDRVAALEAAVKAAKLM